MSKFKDLVVGKRYVCSCADPTNTDNLEIYSGKPFILVEKLLDSSTEGLLYYQMVESNPKNEVQDLWGDMSDLSFEGYEDEYHYYNNINWLSSGKMTSISF